MQSINVKYLIMDIAGVAYNSRISSRARVAEDRGMSWSNDGREILYVEKNETNIARIISFEFNFK